MANATFTVPHPVNEPVRAYAAGSPERESLVKKLNEMKQERIKIPLIIGGKEIFTEKTETVVMPHDHRHVLADCSQAEPEHVDMAIKACEDAWAEWSEMAWEDRAAIFLKAADLLAGPWRDTLNASTMLNQSKTVFQAEIDAACELIDFFRFNVQYMTDIYRDQPCSPPGQWNRLEYRPLEGFILAITPFNFTSIAANLPAAPAMMGNTVIWKPSPTCALSNYYAMKLLLAAGVPAGVINFLPGPPAMIGDKTLKHPRLSGLHFTGSTHTFKFMWKTIAENIDNNFTYPRIVGETGGKDFIFAHESADAEQVACAILRGAFEFQGQKCSAASRVYVPESMWPAVKQKLVADLKTVKMGDVCDFSNFMGAVIDKRSFDKIKGYIDHAREAEDATIVAGGGCDDSQGYFIEPTVIETRNFQFKSACEEIFGPVVTVIPYDEGMLEETLAVVNTTSPYALTGAVFGLDRGAVAKIAKCLRHAAGNFYINDKPTGAVVGQQPFGGSRASGTNDKAGSKLNLLRWVSPRTMKETFVPPTDYTYPFMK